MMSAVRRRQRQLESTATVKGSTKGAATATQRRVIDMYSDIWFTKPEHGDMQLLLIAGLSDTMAEDIVNALNEEFPECKFWME